MNNKKIYQNVALIGAMVSTTFANAMDGDIYEFKGGWTDRVLEQQRHLDRDTKLKDISLLGTHNSYNSEAYGYIDPNQKKSILNQLALGARFIELDVHSVFGGLKLCHNGGYGACSPWDKPFSEGLNEVKQWLQAPDSQNEVLILMIEDHAAGQHHKLYSQLNNKIGPWIYRSENRGNNCEEHNANLGSLTKNAVLQAGKKVVVWKDSGCSDNASLRSLVFSDFSGIEREGEDRTRISAEARPPKTKKFSASEIANKFKAGTNIVALDHFKPDGRMSGAVWSWAEGEPNNYANNEDCAHQIGYGRWNDYSCTASLAFACKHKNTGSWKISTVEGPWNQGKQVCSDLMDNSGNTGNYEFGLPTNSADNDALAQLHSTDVWLNYHDSAIEGRWQKDNEQPAPAYVAEYWFAAGETLYSDSSRSNYYVTLIMQSDGNLVLYNNFTGERLWDSKTFGSNHAAVFQEDGNLVIYRAGVPVWGAGTEGVGGSALLQSDGNFVIYTAQGQPVWSTGTGKF